MAYRFASEQPAGLKNYIEKVAIVGVSHGIIFLVPVSMKTQVETEASDRRAAESGNLFQKSCSKLESIKSPQ